MARSRREFLRKGSLGLAGVALGADGMRGVEAQTPVPPQQTTPGAPTVFGAAPPVGPVVSEATFVEAQKLMRVEFSAEHLKEVAGNWREAMAPVYARRTGPGKVEIGYEDAPGTVWDPELHLVEAHQSSVSDRARVKAELKADYKNWIDKGGVYPIEQANGDDSAIAFQSVAVLSQWLMTRQITSERLTKIYLERLKKFNRELNCVITLTEEHALEQARAADKEIAAGKYRGPLHGIPWGAKDLLDTAGIRTTWGAECFRDRVPKEDAAVTAKLNEAGAVLVAKLSLGALALNDIWFGGQTMNPWNLEEGASGSSAGPGAAVAAGLVGFAIGSETQGSIISPSMRCGVTGLRPTFGRVSRKGAMALSWTCDKLGAMARSVEDTLMVLGTISGYDERDAGSAKVDPVDWSKEKAIAGLRVGYVENWMSEAPATDVDRHALEVVKGLGMKAVPVALPDWNYDSLNIILFAEAAAAFEEITLNGKLDELKMQVPDAWPNTFRQSRFLSAVDFVQADRLRRKVAKEIARVMGEVDLLLVPSLRDEQLVIFNFTGHPSLTLRAGFVEVSEERSDWAPDPKRPLKKFSPPRRVPHGVTLVGRLFDEGTIGQVGMALEKAFGVASERPKGF
jgi:Asp-tRNA(Asn)/Glu-tRNA(Gln) amidotransferase A subunit family amidase